MQITIDKKGCVSKIITDNMAIDFTSIPTRGPMDTANIISEDRKPFRRVDKSALTRENIWPPWDDDAV